MGACRETGTDRLQGSHRVRIGRPNARVGTLALRCAELELIAPRDATDRPPLRVTVVAAIEENPPVVVAETDGALCWMLLSNEGCDGPQTAETV